MIDIQNLTKHYGDPPAQVSILRGISVKIPAGRFVSIMGPSGSGKSTLMHILGCLDQPSSGNYILNGQSVAGLSANKLSEVRRKTIGFIFQTFNLISSLTALENVALPLIYNRDYQNSTRPIQRLTEVGLAHRIHHVPAKLSGGERQRVAIARALINNPDIIMADEPTGSLDSASGKQVMEIIHTLHDQGKTIIMVTHDPEIAAHAQEIIHIRDGLITRIDVTESPPIGGPS